MTRLLLGLLALALLTVQGPSLPGVNTAVKDSNSGHDSGRETPAPALGQSLDPSAAPVSLLGLAPLGEVRTSLGLLDAGPQTHHPRADRSRPLLVELLPALLLRIRWCESRDDYHAVNPRSTASGAWQITDETWHGWDGYARALNAPSDTQDRKALALYADRGTQPWNASRRCWT